MADEQTAEQEEERTDQEDERSDQDEERTEASGEEKSDEAKKAKEKEEEREKAREKMEEIEEDPPGDLEDWPDDAAKYETFGGPEGEHSYEEGPEKKLGPSSLRHHEDGTVTIEGEEVDDADKYKGEPIPGGPTDEDAPQDLTTQKIREDQGRELDSEKDEDGESESGDDGAEASSDGESGDSDSDSDSGAEARAGADDD